jgi:ubiquinone/menaquinone biosynthesis C-methylase UbiE
MDDIAAAFDQRAATYNQNDWHRRSAERLVELCDVAGPVAVLDAGTGTGFAAFAAARRGATVLAVDVSQGMLAKARESAPAELHDRMTFSAADATQLAHVPGRSFDLVLCATALHFMPVGRALREWHRVLRPGGRVAFSTMRAGSPKAADLFRTCALRFGVRLEQPNAPLGTPAACRDALRTAGFRHLEIIEESIRFMPIDLSIAWESSVRSPANAGVLALGEESLAALKAEYLHALEAGVAASDESFVRVDMLYAMARTGENQDP